RRRQTVIRGRRPGRRQRGGRAPLFDVDDFHLDRLRGTGGDAGWRLPEGEAAVTHVALADDTALGVVLRNAVGTIPRTVLAANACVGAVQHDAGRGILRIGVDGTPAQARRVEAL